MHNSICCVAEQFSIQIMRYGTQAGTDCTVNSADITDVRWRTIIYIAPPSATISIRKQNNLPAYQIEPYDILDDINISNSKRTHQAANSPKIILYDNCMTLHATSANPAARVRHYTFDEHSKRIYLVTDSCSAEWQCFSCTVYKLVYLLTYLLSAHYTR